MTTEPTGPEPWPSVDVGGQWASLLTSLAAHRPAGDDLTADVAARGPTGAPATPVTLLTGFLGAGKSTLVARLLAEPAEVGVIRAVVNDIGRLPFDPTTIDASDGASVELTNGCGCCVAGAAAEVGAKLDEQAGGADLVILEASGVADPAALAQVVEARPGLTLDRTVAVLDARSIDQLLELPAPASILGRQLDTAEAIVLSHADGLAASDLAAVTERVGAMAPGCPVVPSSPATPAKRVLTPGFPVGAALPPPGAPTPPALVAVTYDQGEPIAERALAAAIDRGGVRLLRAKGRLLIDGRPTLVQLTPSGWSLTPDRSGRYGLTAVATDDEALAPLADLFPGQSTSRPGSPAARRP